MAPADLRIDTRATTVKTEQGKTHANEPKPVGESSNTRQRNRAPIVGMRHMRRPGRSIKPALVQRRTSFQPPVKYVRNWLTKSIGLMNQLHHLARSNGNMTMARTLPACISWEHSARRPGRANLRYRPELESTLGDGFCTHLGGPCATSGA